jgi:hypothetical protein
MNADLVTAVESASAVCVVGTGSSLSATSGAIQAGWIGLLESGLNELEETQTKNGSWVSTVRSLLVAGRDPDNMEFLLQAASSIGDAFKEIGTVAYAAWLRKSVGSLAVTDSSLPSAICALPVPILTTNYDDILEQAGGRVSSDWTNANVMQQILANRSKSIGHLHGVWTDPDSVILTTADYAKLRSSESAQAIQAAFGATKSIIYIGVGAGLSDPNFSRFLKWQRETFPNPGIRNFRLCTIDELPELRALHRADNIDLVAYGDSHDQLPGFLSELKSIVSGVTVTSLGLVADPVGDARSYFRDDLRAELVTAQDNGDSSLSTDEMMIVPVLLAVPHAQYVSERMSDSGSDSLSRLDPKDDLGSKDLILLAGEEHSGLSFAAKWFALNTAEEIPRLAPIHVEFTSFRQAKPLYQEVRRQARAAGLAAGKKDELPPLALVIDDFSPYSVPITNRVITDLANLDPEFCVITCKQGEEDDVKQKLTEAGFNVRLRYVGKLEEPDIALLAKAIAPLEYKRLTQAVMSLLKSEHLPRTPYTVSQLLFILIKGGALSANSSSTLVLEEYVALLLGRGDAEDDSRFGLDYIQREAILERLAERLVTDDTVGLTDADAVTAIQMILDDLSWPERPLDVLKNFLDRRVLARKGPFITFARGSFLHLFAAKQAQKSTPFRDRLLNRPLYYSSAITDYASLNRHDGVLLDKVEELLSPIEWGTSTGMFAELALVEPNFDPIEFPEAGEDGNSGVESENKAPLALSMADLSDEDPPPFPVADESAIPEQQRRARLVNLASRIVRDADQAGDSSQKRTVLSLLLRGWGGAMSEMAVDPSFIAMLEGIIKEIHVPEDDAFDIEKDVIKELNKLIPVIVTFAGVAEALASRKLLVAMHQIIDSGELDNEPESAVVAVFFLIAVAEQDWPRRVRQVLASQPNTWVIRDFVLFLIFAEYLQATRADESDELLIVAAEILGRATRYKDDAEKRRHQALMLAHFKKMKEMQAAKDRAQASIEARAKKPLAP